MASNHRELEQEIREAWKVLDRDRDGIIAAADLRHVLTTVGEKLTDEEMGELLKEANVDKDGNINFEHFLKVMLTK